RRFSLDSHQRGVQLMAAERFGQCSVGKRGKGAGYDVVTKIAYFRGLIDHPQAAIFQYGSSSIRSEQKDGRPRGFFADPACHVRSGRPHCPTIQEQTACAQCFGYLLRLAEGIVCQPAERDVSFLQQVERAGEGSETNRIACREYGIDVKNNALYFVQD